MINATEVRSKAARLLRVTFAVILAAPIFWLIAYRRWLPFTPLWFDAASFAVGGFSILVSLALGSQDHFDYKKRIDGAAENESEKGQDD
jgi:hypothetical protein